MSVLGDDRLRALLPTMARALTDGSVEQVAMMAYTVGQGAGHEEAARFIATRAAHFAEDHPDLDVVQVCKAIARELCAQADAVLLAVTPDGRSPTEEERAQGRDWLR